MSCRESAFSDRDNVRLDDCLPGGGCDSVAGEIIAGLAGAEKHISCVHFYDAAGSRLFEQITHLPEYYPTRIEKELLRKVSLEIGGKLGGADIIEFGSGDCSKISILLEAVPPREIETIRYVPVEISRSAIRRSAAILCRSFPGLQIHGVIADFTKHLSRVPGGARRLFCFLGGTIGNFSRARSVEFMRNLRELMDTDDRLLVGFDMVKDTGVLERAYNDSRLVTAAFNKNILKAVNAKAGTDFDPDVFEHLAFYNEEQCRIEMRLRALEDVEISFPHPPGRIFIARGETIHTENSHKYTQGHIADLASRAGLAIERTYTDENKWYSLVLFTPG